MRKNLTFIIISVIFLSINSMVFLNCEVLNRDEGIHAMQISHPVEKEIDQPLNQYKNDSIGLVVLDAGHGGTDGGSIGNGYIEKDITLEITKKIGAYLEEQHVDVIYTRQNDNVYSENTLAELKHRVEISNVNFCDAFVSIHLNSSDEEVKGYEIWTSFSNLQSLSLAESVNQALHDLNYTNTRDIKNQDESNLYVLNYNDAPSMLIELGFITLYEDMMYLGNDVNQNKISKSIADTW